MSEGKKYGLILPKKTACSKPAVTTGSIFGDDDDEDSRVAVNQNLQNDSKKALLKRQVQLEMEKALAADPTVYEYDSIYDDLQTKKAEVDKRVSATTDRKPKYIGNLIKAAEDRKKEMERRLERKIHKERQTEKGKYDDKEAFVTGAYREKMELMRQEEEEERRKEQMEVLNDVTKQSDLTGFYRNLLKQTVGENTAATVVQSPVDTASVSVDPDDRDDSSQSESSTDSESSSSNEVLQGSEPQSSRKQQQQHSKDRHLCDISRHDKDDESRHMDKDSKYDKSKSDCLINPRKRHDVISSRESELESSGTYEKRQRTAKSATDAVNSSIVAKRTSDNSLQDARAKFLARKAAMNVPVIKEDSD